MKKLQNSIVLIILTFSCFPSFSQIRLGVAGGVNMNYISYGYNKESDEPNVKLKAGFHIGLTSDFMLNDVLSLQPSLLFTTKGTKGSVSYPFFNPNDNTNYDVTEDYKINFNYLELPVLLAFKVSSFQFSLGPYIGIALGGRFTSNYTLVDENNQESKETGEFAMKPVTGEVDFNDFGDDERVFPLFDYGLKVGVGYRIDKVLISANYALGFKNLTVDVNDGIDPNDFKTFNRVLSLSVGYFFW